MQPITFGPWLKALRKALDMTRAQMAQQVGCAEITLGKIERDERRPSRQIAELLADALQVPIASHAAFVQFARGVGEPPVLDEAELPATSAQSQPPTNLPAPLTSFIDRVSELAAVRDRLLQPDVRLVTLVGPPGIGKTRLSIQVGQALLDQFTDGVWFIALAPIGDPALVLPTIARFFNIADAGATPLLVRLQDHLWPKHLLLILDNFEHVLDVAPIVTDLLKACPKLKVLTTSREPLHAYGEHEYPMPALSLPPQGKTLTAEQLAEFDAIKLFVARAQACRGGFELNPGNAQVIADICLRLDGLPLAIELAAAQLRKFDLLKLREALHDAPLKALVGATCDIEPRQRTLRNAIQWSYDLLSLAECSAFARLGVFVGGCSTEAALVVCELPDDALLHALADRSLITSDARSRWTMLEMIREFALDALAQSSGDELERAQQRHTEYFARIFQPGDDEAYDIIDVEQHNARAALRWLLDHKQPLAGELALFMNWYFHCVGSISEARRMLLDVLSANILLTPPVRYGLLSSATIHASHQHDFEEAWRYTHEALTIARAMNSPTLIADALIDHGMVFIWMDDYAQTKQVALEALRIGRTIQDSELIVGALNQLGKAALEEGDVCQAGVFFDEAYALCQTPDWRQPIFATQTCKGLGEIALSRRDYVTAMRFLREGLAYSKTVHMKLWVLNVLAGVIGTMPHRTTADVYSAANIWGATEALNEKMGHLTAPGDHRRTDALIAEARARIDPEAFVAAWAEGRELSLDEVIALVPSP